jgi:hypothetical protein
MIYVISKSTSGPYNVRDIQCNANWCDCPYSDYALIPDNLVDGILATQGYCDITLNTAGTEVVSFTPRSIPTVEENRVCNAPAIESTEHPGCYYRYVNGNVEWINPPMYAHNEYRTSERWRGKVVYTKMFYPNTTLNGKQTADIDIPGLVDIVRNNCWVYNAPIIEAVDPVNSANFGTAFCFTGTKLYVWYGAEGHQIVLQVWYTKN